jgi:hypothetical protein
MFNEQEIMNYLDSIPSSSLKYHDPDADSESEYDERQETPVFGTISDMGDSSRMYLMYFKNGGAIRNYGCIDTIKSKSPETNANIYFCEGDLHDEYEFSDQHRYDLNTTYTLTYGNGFNKEQLLKMFNDDINENSEISKIAYLYGYLWMNAKIMGLIEDIISIDDIDEKDLNIENIHDEEEMSDIRNRCDVLIKLITSYIENL